MKPHCVYCRRIIARFVETRPIPQRFSCTLGHAWTFSVHDFISEGNVFRCELSSDNGKLVELFMDLSEATG